MLGLKHKKINLHQLKKEVEQVNLKLLTNQANNIQITSNVRLVPFDGLRKESYCWYQDQETMKNIVGKPLRYTKRQVFEMYEWQHRFGELYYIEYRDPKEPLGSYFTIGDVWLSADDYAIVIDKKFQNQHIGRNVTNYFIHYAKKKGQKYFIVSEVFNWNKASQRMFSNLKLYPYKENQDSWSYRRYLQKEKNILTNKMIVG